MSVFIIEIAQWFSFLVPSNLVLGQHWLHRMSLKVSLLFIVHRVVCWALFLFFKGLLKFSNESIWFWPYVSWESFCFCIILICVEKEFRIANIDLGGVYVTKWSWISDFLASNTQMLVSQACVTTSDMGRIFNYSINIICY